jgi:hypothetical protein
MQKGTILSLRGSKKPPEVLFLDRGIIKIYNCTLRTVRVMGWMLASSSRRGKYDAVLSTIPPIFGWPIIEPTSDEDMSSSLSTLNCTKKNNNNIKLII